MNPSIDLEAAKAAFFASGGQIIVLEGLGRIPRKQASTGGYAVWLDEENAH